MEDVKIRETIGVLGPLTTDDLKKAISFLNEQFVVNSEAFRGKEEAIDKLYAFLVSSLQNATRAGSAQQRI